MVPIGSAATSIFEITTLQIQARLRRSTAMRRATRSGFFIGTVGYATRSQPQFQTCAVAAVLQVRPAIRARHTRVKTGVGSALYKDESQGFRQGKRAEIVKLHAACNHLMLDRCVAAVIWTMMSQQNWIVTWSHAPGAMRALPLCEISPANFGGWQFEEGYPNGVDEGAICLAMSSTRFAGVFHGEAEGATVGVDREGSSVWPAVSSHHNYTSDTLTLRVVLLVHIILHWTQIRQLRRS
jgi:hypothetical protein